jgi:SH3 domain-containing YSC84-like protein 1
MKAEILSYSRSRGLFAGISLEGSTIRPDDDASADVYGYAVKAKDIVRGNGTHITLSGRGLVDALQKGAPQNESEKSASR